MMPMVTYPSEVWIMNHVYTPSIRFYNPYFWWRMEQRKLTIHDVDTVLQSCKIIEVLHYCDPLRILVNGHTREGVALHIAFAVKTTPVGGWWLDAITVYKPHPALWETSTKRRILQAFYPRNRIV